MRHFVLHHEGKFYYYVDTGWGSQGSVFADGEQLERAAERGWWIAGHEAKRIEVESPPTRKLLSYKLVEDVPASEKYPATLTLEQYAERDEYDVKLSALYEGEYEEVPAKRSVVEETFKKLEGAPPPNDGHQYFASLPYELSNHPEYRHLFPGHLDGFRKVLAERLKELPGVSAYDQSTFSVYVVVNYDKPVDYFEVGPRGGRKKRTSHSVTRAIKGIRPPHRIEADNRADAVKKWDALMEQYVASVRRAVEVKLCSHCQGHGILKPQVDE